MAVFVHPQGICESSRVGDGTRIWAFAHVLSGAQLGSDCNICDHVFIENDVVLGDRVTVKSGVQLWDGVRIGDDVFVGPNATFTNDKFPRSKQYPEQFAETVIEDGASIGANVTLLPGLRIGRKAVVGAGAVVTHNVPPGAIVQGNPARIAGYVASGNRQADATPMSGGTVASVVSGEIEGPLPVLDAAVLLALPVFRDARGVLAVAEFARDLPFVPQRCFLVHDVPSQFVRGEHAHRECEQVLVCVAGSVSVVLDNGSERKEVLLDRPNVGIYVPPMMWSTQYRYSRESVLLVFASHPYDAADYIRDYDEYLAAIGSQS